MSSRRPLPVAVRLVAGVALVIASAAHAAQLTTTDLQLLAERADVIVRVRVTSAEPRWLDDSGPSRIVTFHEARLLEVVRGRLSDEEARAGQIVVGVPGGAVDDIAQHVPGAPLLEVGRDYILLLGRGDGPGNARGVAGLSYGAIEAGPALRPLERAYLEDLLPLLRPTEEPR